MAKIDLLFAIRGILAFAAFTELTTSFRCALGIVLPEENGSYVSSKLFSLSDLVASEDADRIVGHLFGLVCFINASALIHLAVFSHCRPLISLAASTAASKLLLIFLHLVVFRTVSADHNLIFPLVTGILTLLAILSVPFVAGSEGQRYDMNDYSENEEMEMGQIWDIL